MFDRKPMIGIAALGLTLSLTGAAQAIPFSYSQNFEGEDGSQPADWTVLREGLAIQDDAYHTDISGTALSAFDGEDAELWLDYTVTAEYRQSFWTSSTGVHTGPAARVQDSGNFYAAELRNTNFRIWREGTGDIGNRTVASEDLGGDFEFDTESVYQIEFTLEGSSLSAVLFDPEGEALSSISGTDDSFAQGPIGTWARPGGHDAEFHSISAEGTMIPEPGTAALAGLGLGALLVRRQRRSRD